MQVKGYLHVRFEGTAIYLSKADADHLITSNGFWVTFDEKKAISAESKKFDEKYVLMEGTFNKDNLGHLGLWQGAIEKVDRIVELD